MFNKPAGCITATYDENFPTVMDYFSDYHFSNKLFPVGRLDIDTEGLLIITTDGLMAHRLAHPKWKIEKEYYAVVEGNAFDIDTEKIKKGIKLKDGYQTKPFEIKILSESEILITITEGKYHIVKRIMETLSHPVKYLKRIRIGNLKLDENLSAGEFRELTEEEIKSLKSLVSIKE